MVAENIMNWGDGGISANMRSI